MFISSDKIKAIILGHAVADALGVPVEFMSRDRLRRNPVTDMTGFGTYNVPEGSWSDDTSMEICALESLAKGSLDSDDIMRNFVRWYEHGEFTPTGLMFDVGNACSTAIRNYTVNGLPAERCGLLSENSNGNGSLMRIIPFVLFSAVKNDDDLNALCDIISVGSSLTHAHQRSILACDIYGSVLMSLLKNPDKKSVEDGINAIRQIKSGEPEYSHFSRVDADTLKHLSCDEIDSSGYSVSTLEAALWCLLRTESYSECVLTAVNLGDDTDTVGAVAGGLAGALYGLEAIPEGWLSKLKRRDYLEDMCEKAAAEWNR